MDGDQSVSKKNVLSTVEVLNTLLLYFEDGERNGPSTQSA